MHLIAMALKLIRPEKAIIATIPAVGEFARISFWLSAMLGLVMSKHASEIFEFTVAMLLWASVVIFIQTERRFVPVPRYMDIFRDRYGLPTMSFLRSVLHRSSPGRAQSEERRTGV